MVLVILLLIIEGIMIMLIEGVISMGFKVEQEVQLHDMSRMDWELLVMSHMDLAMLMRVEEVSSFHKIKGGKMLQLE
jgi:hypothetical protein